MNRTAHNACKNLILQLSSIIAENAVSCSATDVPIIVVLFHKINLRQSITGFLLKSFLLLRMSFGNPKESAQVAIFLF
jgi:hypothetical protein